MIRVDELSQGAWAAHPLEVGAVGSLSTLAGMREEWAALMDASDAGPFNAWEWVYPWCRRIATGRRPLVLTARDAVGTLVGLMPLGVEYLGVTGIPVRRLSFLGRHTSAATTWTSWRGGAVSARWRAPSRGCCTRCATNGTYWICRTCARTRPPWTCSGRPSPGRTSAWRRATCVRTTR